MTSLIPCTVQVLTRNSAEGIKSCLDSLTDFAEVIVQDAFSTDGTREIASAYSNVRLMDQNRAYLTEEGRIIDFSAMRNESIKAAKHEWIFVVDGDERTDPALVKEVADIVATNQPGVFQAFRRFYIDDEPVMFCSGYPAYQIRLFHRFCIEGYVKPVHERLNLRPTVTVQTLATELPVPQPPVAQLRAKYDRYLLMEVKRVGVLPWGRWLRWVLLRNLKTAIGLSLRVIGLRLLPEKGKRMPLSYEFAYIHHSLRTIIHTFPPLVKSRMAVHTS